MAVPMMMRMHLHFFNSHHAPVRNLAIDIFKLNRRVMDVKARGQRLANLAQQLFAF